MKDYKLTDEDLRNSFTGIRLPDIDVTKSVMQRINRKQERESRFRWRNPVIGIVLSIALLLTAGFSAIKVWDLAGPGGLSYQYELLDKRDPLPPEEVYLTQYKSLEPGKALAIMKTKNNDKNAIHLLPKQIGGLSLEELTRAVGEKFREPSVIPPGYVFREGAFDYKMDESYREEMIKESRNTDKDYLIKVVEPLQVISHYDIIYKNDNKTIMVSAFFNYPIKNIQDIEKDHKATKVTIKDFEAIYVEHDGFSDVAWLEKQDGSTTYYLVRSNSLYDNVKEDLVKLCESMK
jgi:hypothetical protein